MTLSLIVIFSSSFLIALSGALMPGPLLTVTVSESTQRGAVTGPLVILGHGILELGMVLALFAGLAPFLKRAEVFIVIALAGGIILLWMAISMFRSLPTLHLDLTGEEQKPKNLIMTGIVMSLANPYWTIWWATIGLGVAFFIGHILADLAWYALISFSVAKGRSFFTETFYRRLIGGCACFLVLFAGYFFYSGIEKLV
jgi:threonine/homoserine/homoserine lactone efflux protein